MLEKTSTEFRKVFLLYLAKELIKNSKTGAVIELENVLREKRKKENLKKKEIQRKKISEVKRIKKLPLSKGIIPERAFHSDLQRKPRRPLFLRIPEPRLPQGLQFLRPIPTNFKIDLGKLNPLIADPAVRLIECNGPDKKIIIQTGIKRPTNIILDKEEIEGIVEKFSGIAKIPLHEGVFRVALGNLLLSAIISDVIIPKFIIRKISQNQPFTSFKTFPMRR